jgi:hypothetical protein
MQPASVNDAASIVTVVPPIDGILFRISVVFIASW